MLLGDLQDTCGEIILGESLLTPKFMERVQR